MTGEAPIGMAKIRRRMSDRGIGIMAFTIGIIPNQGSKVVGGNHNVLREEQKPGQWLDEST
jgi:hypothetical protein